MGEDGMPRMVWNWTPEKELEHGNKQGYDKKKSNSR